MGWLWQFLDLTPEDKQNRRAVLDNYASIAQSTSIIVPVLSYIIANLLLALLQQFGKGRAGDRHGAYQQVSDSDEGRGKSETLQNGWGRTWRKLGWWLEDEVHFRGRSYGCRDQWVFGLAWAAWLLGLSVVGTGKDYFHLSKRFGLIAMSQLPAHYALSNKILNPYAWMFSSSHEAVNRYHRVSGRIIYFLLLVHFVLYINSFVVKGVLFQRFFESVVFLGIVASIMMHAVAFTSMSRVRQYSYRLFFITHTFSAVLIPVVIFFHADAARWYVAQAFAISFADGLIRKLTATVASATVELIPGSNLIRISLDVTPSKASEFNHQPGSHLYLKTPAEGRVESLGVNKTFFDLIQNPFTVATVDQQRGLLTVVARKRSGPMSKHLSHVAGTRSSSKTLLSFEGPYGLVGKHYKDIVSAGASRVLLIAGGVGATFTLPVYRAILQLNPEAKISFIWAIRDASDATWAISPSQQGPSITDDSNIELYVTGEIDIPDSPIDETDEIDGLDSVEMETITARRYSARENLALHNKRRPDLRSIVDDTFSHSGDDTVSVIVCGPDGMAEEVRQHVGIWVGRGRDVRWHNEHFGW